MRWVVVVFVVVPCIVLVYGFLTHCGCCGCFQMRLVKDVVGLLDLVDLFCFVEFDFFFYRVLVMLQ